MKSVNETPRVQRSNFISAVGQVFDLTNSAADTLPPALVSSET